jgi:hypothetical protein
MSAFIVDELRKDLIRWREARAASIFRSSLDAGQIEFRGRGDAGDWFAHGSRLDNRWRGCAAASQSDGRTAPSAASSFLSMRRTSTWMRRLSLFTSTPRPPSDGGTETARIGEIRAACWRRGNVYPDFVFAALRRGRR